MKGRETLSWAVVPLRAMAGAVLAVSGYLKAVRPAAEFAATLESYWIFPLGFTVPIARIVPWIELIVGLALLLGFFTRGASLVAAGLYVSFVAVLGQSIFRKLPLADCGCFGQVGPHLLPIQALTLDVVLLSFCLAVFFDRGKKMSLDRWIHSDR